MHRWVDVGMLVGYIAIVFLLVRPRSQGPTLVKAGFSGAQGILSTVTGGGTW